MDIIENVGQMQNTAVQLREKGHTIGLVPTMGYLHEGHLSLVNLAREHADKVIVSIYVNPTQFGPNEDLDKYPRDLERDCSLCEEHGVDIVFHPKSTAVYTPGHSVFVNEDRLSRVLCGASRPGHFRGVLTIVAKLFNMTLPHTAVFGQKDVQQAILIQRMTHDLNFPIRILTGPIIREPDGLAMSSRNKYLSPTERSEALCLHDAITRAEELFASGQTDTTFVIDEARSIVTRCASAEIDYMKIVDREALQPVAEISRGCLMAMAVKIGKTRLIDNTVF